MATISQLTSRSSTAAVKDEKGVAGWNKTVTDMNNVDELFRNARDVGYLRMNVSRVNVIGRLSAKYDSSDLYKVQIQSNGKLRVALRSGDTEDSEKVMDMSKYEKALREAGIDVNLSGDEKKSTTDDTEKSLIEQSAPGAKMLVYMKRGGREVLVADSHAAEGSKLRIAADQMLTGDYKAKKGDYYVKLERDDTIQVKDELMYALQMQVGDSYKHDYTITEKISDDVKNKKISKVQATQLYGVLSNANALEIQATKYEATANMLADSYLNLASIYNRNK